MESVLEFAKGPLFATTFAFMVFGLARQVFLQATQVTECVMRLSSRRFNIRRNARDMLVWMAPVRRIYGHLPLIGASSFLFHVGLLIVPLLLVSHVAMWGSAIGLTWPAIPMLLADVLTLTTIASGLVLLGARVFNRDATHLSEPIDYFILLALMAPFVTGYMALHPWANPVSYSAMLLLHVLSSELVFVLIPTTKLSHCVLFPFNRFSSDVFWNLPSGSGERVAHELHGEGARV